MNPLKCLMKHHDICSGCQSVSPLKSTLDGDISNRIPLVETIYPKSSFDELCITSLRRYLNRIELTYILKISNIFPYIPLLIFTLLLKPIIDPVWTGWRKKTPEFILHLTENIFMSILAFPSHNSQNRIIIGHTFLKSRFCCFPGKNPIEINIILEEVSVSMKRSRTRLLHELM